MALFETGVRWASVTDGGKMRVDQNRRRRFSGFVPALLRISRRKCRKVIARRHEQERTITPELSELLGAERSARRDPGRCAAGDGPRPLHQLRQLRQGLRVAARPSRLIRNGIQIGKYLVPSACRHCDDPKCMNSCPTGAIKRRTEGEIYFPVRHVHWMWELRDRMSLRQHRDDRYADLRSRAGAQSRAS